MITHAQRTHAHLGIKFLQKGSRKEESILITRRSQRYPGSPF